MICIQLERCSKLASESRENFIISDVKFVLKIIFEVKSLPIHVINILTVKTAYIERGYLLGYVYIVLFPISIILRCVFWL